jgi:hypothetical protein
MSLQSSRLVAMLSVSGAVGLWSYPAQAQVSSSAAVLLKDKAVTVGDIDHVLVAFRRTDPRWQYEVHRPLIIRWLVRGLLALRPGPSGADLPSGELVIFLKDKRQINIRVSFDEKSQKVQSVGDDFAIPGEDLQAAFGVLFWRVQNLATRSDKDWKTTDVTIFEAVDLHRSGRVGMAVVEAFEEALLTMQRNKDLATMIKALVELREILHSPGSRFEHEQGAKGEVSLWYEWLAQDLAALGQYDRAIQWLQSLQQLFADDKTEKQGFPCNVLMNLFARRSMADVYAAKGQYTQAISLLAETESMVNEFLPHMKAEQRGGWEAYVRGVHEKQKEWREKTKQKDGATVGPSTSSR